jgi:hypothetical protein
MLSADLPERAVDDDWHMHDVIIDSLGDALIRDTRQTNAARVRLKLAETRENLLLSRDQIEASSTGNPFVEKKRLKSHKAVTARPAGCARRRSRRVLLRPR